MNKHLKNKYSFSENSATLERQTHSFKVPATFQYLIFGAVLIVVMMLSVEKVLPYSWWGGLVYSATYGISAIGFCLLMGYSGLASLGTGGFIGIGCYSVYYIMTLSGLPFFLAVVVAIGVAVAIGAIVGFISLRIESIYLVILTLALSEILRNVYMVLQDSINIGTPKLFGIALKSTDLIWLIVPILVVIMILTHNLIASPTGRAMLAMKNSTAAAQAMGISVLKYRLTAFILCTVYASLSGTLLILRSKSATASSGTGMYALITSLNILAAVIIGGYKSIWGALFGAFVMYGLNTTILQRVQFFQDNPALITILSGVLVIIIVMFYPGGLAQLMHSLKGQIKKLFKKMKEARYGKDIG